MRRLLSWIILISGFLLFVYGLLQFIFLKEQQQSSLIEAQEVIRTSSSPSTNKKSVSTKPNRGEVIGLLSIPKIDAELAIIEGTDPDELERGVGHYSESSLPGEKNQILLSGHRDTVFRNLGKVSIGDKLTIKLSSGNYTYEIFKTKIVDAHDRTVIQSTYPEEILVLTTCYPFSYIGNAPERYIIYAKRT
ncbi:class D sortase [Fictibacillus nanhaiensis]|uniref:class D sortase n=1 Tax=Fictibacillus nanhaiensis TaxID=742169 RepID=UPI003C1E8031